MPRDPFAEGFDVGVRLALRSGLGLGPKIMSDTTDALLDLLSKHAPAIVSMLQTKQSDRMEVFRKAFEACETSTQKTDLAIRFFETSGAGFGTPEAIQQAMAAAQGGTTGPAPADDDSTH